MVGRPRRYARMCTRNISSGGDGTHHFGVLRRSPLAQRGVAAESERVDQDVRVRRGTNLHTRVQLRVQCDKQLRKGSAREVSPAANWRASPPPTPHTQSAGRCAHAGARWPVRARSAREPHCPQLAGIARNTPSNSASPTPTKRRQGAGSESSSDELE
eukprot:gnl/Spiro4/4508_TR2238_c0_g1_i1.p3 gnl/Spiro4/4508_TR2238_c0_g1~~gnl/Spiro4/4508_TR2238_c0_g1_i1.p3  ORF type:complete len:158 (+),score=26.39 gnl/Spiro4/4508_TR2238_c0_g1_i1:252-725(+)